MPKHHLRCFDVVAVFVVVGGLGSPEVVALDCLAVLLKKACQPLSQGFAGCDSSLCGENYSVVRRILLLSIGFHCFHNFRGHRQRPRASLLRFKSDHYVAVVIRDSLCNL